MQPHSASISSVQAAREPTASASEREKYVAVASFCRQHGVEPPNLQKWLADELQSHSDALPVGLDPDKESP